MIRTRSSSSTQVHGGLSLGRAEKPCPGPGVEDPRVALDETSADRRDRSRREVALGAGEVVVVDGGDPLVLGSQLVEVARAVGTVDVDPPLVDR